MNSYHFKLDSRRWAEIKIDSTPWHLIDFPEPLMHLMPPLWSSNKYRWFEIASNHMQLIRNSKSDPSRK